MVGRIKSCGISIFIDWYDTNVSYHGIAIKKKGRPPKDYVVREEDKVAELQAEIAILESYLPKQMSAEEVAAKVSELIAAAGLEPIVKNKGMIMKTVMAELKGKADGKVIGAAVDALLS